MPKKIFELAKELNIGPLDLVEDLKSKGFAVRNHMTVLSDEDLEAVMKLLAEKASEQEPKPKKKVVKKKAVKKAAVKKTAAKKATTVQTVKEEVEEKKSKSKKTVKRKKTVIRRRVPDAKEEEVKEPVVQEGEQVAEEVQAETAAPEVPPAKVEDTAPEQEATIPKAAGEQQGDGGEDDVVTGLRVVSRPEIMATDPEKDAAVAEEAREETGQKERQEEPKEEKEKGQKKAGHKFTPIYIPSRDDKNKVAKSGTDEQGASTGGDVVPGRRGGGTAEEPDDDSKKRFSGLASMISAKGKKIINKSRELSLSRAEDELKTFSTLNIYGRPIYTQAKRKKVYTGPSAKTRITEVKESKRVITIHKCVKIGDLATKLSVKFGKLANKVMDINLLVEENDVVGIGLASEIAALYDYRVEDRAFKEEEIIGQEELTEEQKEKLPLRSPIITIMGHVDHGKTTLLDHIRKAKVVQSEDGGITQHIGAYSVMVKDKKLTFLDTPGHAAFGAMRQRGANVTDIVVLVVAADDGVMPQTRESIRFCQQAEVPLLVAINKMDKEGVNPDRIKQALSEFDITPEDWGGDTQFVNISALKGMGIDDLLEAIALQAEIMELRADPKGKAEGVVIESKIETGRGPMATILIQRGTLKKGDSVVVGESYGRARSLMDDSGKDVSKAGPSTPVQILGLDNAPNPGDLLNVVKNEREAKKVVTNRINDRKELESAPATEKVSLEDFFSMKATDGEEKKTLKLIVRSDVQGSFEAIKQSLEAINNAEVEVKVIGGGVGPISDSDVVLASSSQGFIIGFNMRPVTSARKMSEVHGVDVKTYSVIYELIDDVKMAAEGLLAPEVVEQFIGRAEVRDTFTVPKIGVIAGSMVVDGSIRVGCNIRLIRHGKIIFDGKLSSLKRFKDDVKEVKNGYECGIGLESFNDIKVDDIIEAYVFENKKRKLEDIGGETSGEQ